MRPFTIATAGAALLAAGLPAPAPAQGQFHWQGHLAAGKRLEIKGVNGDIQATAGSGDQAEVTATKHARNSDTASVEIRVVPFAGGVAICAVYPPSRGAREPNGCDAGPGYHSSTENNDVVVDFAVRVPAGVELSATTVNGHVDADGLAGNVDANTVNGSIHLSTSGYAEARTVNGSIGATVGRADWTDRVGFETVNGGITLTFPASLSTEVRAETVNGDIESDFPLPVSGRFGPRRVNGTIGSGGRKLELHTVNGGIRLKKST